MDRFRRMQIFVTVVEAGQITKAANILNISKSAVSHALKDLETYLDLPLLIRSNRSWHVSDVGKTYYENCKRVLADVETIEDKVRDENQTLSGLIRISASNTFGPYTLAPVVSKFMDLHPDIVIEISLSDRFVDLVEERVDLAFRTGNVKNSDYLKALTIGVAQTFIVASPDYIKKHGMPKSHNDLKTHKCIQYNRSPIWRMTKDGRSYEFTPNGPIFADSGEIMREFCIRGQGLAMMPTMLGEFALKKGRLVKVLTEYQYAPMLVQALRINGNRAPTRVIKLLDFVVEELRTRERDIAEFV